MDLQSPTGVGPAGTALATTLALSALSRSNRLSHTHHEPSPFKLQKYWRIIYFLLFYSTYQKEKKGGILILMVSCFVFAQDKSRGQLHVVFNFSFYSHLMNEACSYILVAV